MVKHWNIICLSAPLIPNHTYKNYEGFQTQKGQKFFVYFIQIVQTDLQTKTFSCSKRNGVFFSMGKAAGAWRSLTSINAEVKKTIPVISVTLLTFTAWVEIFHFTSVPRKDRWVILGTRIFPLVMTVANGCVNVSIILYNAKVKCRKGSSLPYRLNCLWHARGNN